MSLLDYHIRSDTEDKQLYTCYKACNLKKNSSNTSEESMYVTFPQCVILYE